MEKKVTVLIVDDLDLNVEMLTDILKDNYNILSAGNGEEALGILKEKSADLVLLDIIMPKMDGCETLKRMREDEELKNIPVVAVTSEGDPELRAKVLELGAVDYVLRGEDADALKHRLASVLKLSELNKLRSENESMKKKLRSEKHLSALMDNIPGGIGIIKTDGENAACTFYNKELPELFGMSPEEFDMQFISEEKPKWLSEFVRNAGESGNFTQIFCLGDENSADNCQWIRLSAGGLDERDGRRELYCVFLDINAEKIQELRADKANKMLHTNENHLEALLDNAPGGIAYAERGSDGKMELKFASLGLAEMLGYPDFDACVNSITENPCVGVSDEDVDIIKEKIERSLKSGKHLKYSFACLGRDGSELWLHMRGQTAVTDEGKVCLYAFVTNLTKEKQIEEELRTVAYFDPLTKLYNRSAFMKEAQEILYNNPRREYSILKLNIGGFKVINDVLGRDVGDRLLKAVADSLKSTIGDSGICARLFADNFMALIPYSERSVHPQTILDAAVKATEQVGEISHEVQYYVGVYRVTDLSVSVDSMADRASIACRSITGSFREHIAYYDDKMRRRMIEEQELCDESHRALVNGEFYVCYQPIYGIKAKKFVSAEALVRWNHPTKGQILPTKFIPLFEKNGFIAELDLYVLEQVCIYQKKRSDMGLPPFPISVNVSRMSLYNPNLFDIISELTDRYGVDPKYFRIEITETAYNDNPAQLLDTVGRLRRRCFPVLMDDFGSGYSSLNTLKDIPIDILKLDMKFMQNFEKNNRVGTIVTSIARMSKWLNVPLLAEGVETREQYEFLASVGCAYIQGFYFSRPVPEGDFTTLVAQEEITGFGGEIESYGMGEEVSELLGSNSLVSKFISSVFGGLGIYEMVGDKLELIRANDGYMQIMGYTPDNFSEENENTDIWSKMPENDAEISKNACMEALRTDKAVRASVRRYDRSGRVLHLDGIHRRLGGTDENPIFCIAFNNITDKIESDRILERSRDRIEQAMSTTDSVILDIDFKGNEDGSDSVYCVGDLSAYGFEMEDMAEYVKGGRIFSNVTHPDDLERVRVFHDDRTRGKISEEFRLFNKVTNSYKWWRFTETRSFAPDGSVARLVGIGTNIDNEKRASIALEEAHGRINAAMNDFSEGILVMEMYDGNKASILYSNSSFWKIIGKPRSDNPDILGYIRSGVDGKDLADIISKSKKGEPLHITYHTTKSDGRGAWIDLKTAPSGTGQTERTYMVIVSDVTEQVENRAKLDAIMKNYKGGLALVVRENDKYTVDYANDRFFEILRVKPSDGKRLSSMLSAAVSSGADTGDLRIHGNGVNRIIRIHLEKISSPDGSESFVVTANDVTLKRSESKNRITERMAYAAAGLYDVVYDINLKNHTAKLVQSRKKPLLAQQSVVMPVDSVFKEWEEKFIHPDDISIARALYHVPVQSPDFTDSYAEFRISDVPNGREYHTYGAVIVRSGQDRCSLFMRDNMRVDDTIVSSQVADLDRIYRMVAEQTKTTVIEYDHVTNRAVCTPSIEEYYAARLSREELLDREEFRKGLAIHPDDRGNFADFVEKVYSSDEAQSIILRMKMADDSYKWCRLTVSLTRKGSAITKSLCTINQVHNEVIARRKAEQTDELLRKTIRHIPVGAGIFRFDDGAVVPVYLSDNIYEMYGVKRGNLDEVPVLSAERLEREGKLAPNSEGEYIQDALRADGSRFWYNVKYRVFEEQGELMIYAAVIDVSDKIQSSRHKAVEEQLYQVLIQETGTIIFNYAIESDELNYLRHTVGEKNSITTIRNFIGNSEPFDVLSENDRANFVTCLKKLSDDEGVEELPVKIDVDGYPRRFKVFMKSVCDSENVVFEIIGKIEDVDDEVARLEKIQAKAMYDSLCVNIYNKATTEELIRAELERSTGGALMMIDVDDFKSINDRLGHMFGDEFLKKFATTVKSIFRDTDIVGRYGGDEFFVFMPHATGALAEKKGKQILQRVSQISVPELGTVKSSIGVTAVNPDNRNYKQILSQADSALYEAKNRGKNCVVAFNAATMEEGVYRTENEQGGRERTHSVVLSGNPNMAGSLAMRIFSMLYTSMDITDGINQALELLGKTFDVSRAYIFEDSPDGRFCSNTFEWCNEGVESVMYSLQSVSYKDDLGGNYRENMNDDGIFYCHDINTLSEKHRDILARQDIKSVLQCAISDKGEFKGFVGFDECRSNRFWTQEQVDSLVFLSKVISIFLMKARLG